VSGGALPHTACAVCGHVLNQYTGSFGETWIHALEEDKDHPAVPVPSGSIRTISLCDFCLEPDAAWVLPVEDYRAGPESESVGDWQCCAGCAALLERGDWEELSRRALTAIRDRGQIEGAELAVFWEMYRQLREHITGPVRLARG
jgi:hypothetical protein